MCIKKALDESEGAEPTFEMGNKMMRKLYLECTVNGFLIRICFHSNSNYEHNEQICCLKGFSITYWI